MNTTVTVALAVGALVVLTAAVALRLADRIGLPSLLLYLAFGVALVVVGAVLGVPTWLWVAALVALAGGAAWGWVLVARITSCSSASPCEPGGGRSPSTM